MIDSIEDEDVVALLTQIAVQKTNTSGDQNAITALPVGAREELYQSYAESFDRDKLLTREEFEANLDRWNAKS